MSEKQGYQLIVVGTDGSNLADATVRRAALAAAREQAALVVVCAFAEMPGRVDAKSITTIGGDPRIDQVAGREAAQQALSEAVGIAAELGVIASTALIDGEPAKVLLTVVADHKADLLVVGATHDRTLADRLLGTVAEDVVKRAPCDVLIVRPPAA